MSRSPEVEAAMRNTESGMYCTDDADALAAEVERLEVALAKADEAARAAMYAVDERAFLAESAEKSEKRAETAEARVRELEAQNARLRKAYHTVRVKVVQIANGEPEEMRDALFLLTKETDSLAEGKAAPS